MLKVKMQFVNGVNTQVVFIHLAPPLFSALFSTFSILLALYRRRPRHLPNNADGTAPTAALLVTASFFFLFIYNRVG